jgi:predicted enzyme related to lactoylglutathione lyase
MIPSFSISGRYGGLRTFAADGRLRENDQQRHAPSGSSGGESLRGLSGGQTMKRLWTIVGVENVGTSFKWYQALFGQPHTAPAHEHFGQILDADGTVLLCLHQWGAHEHPTLTDRRAVTPGNGLLLFFRVDDYDAALTRARALAASLAEEPHVNPNTKTREFSLRDPDGYYVTISQV